MTFINPLLAFGALAFVIPLVIHILNRSRFKTVQWGAMHLLESVIKVNHKRFRIDQLILLLVRCLIPMLLAFCIARPLLTGSKSMEAETPVSLVVVLDTSYSMDAKDQAGTKMQSALESARDLIAATHKGSDIYVLQVGEQPLPLFDQPVFDADAVIRRLDGIEATYGACKIENAFQAALETLGKMSNGHRELVVISDFQQADWSQTLENQSSEVRTLVEGLEIQPIISFIPIGKQVKDNVSIQSIEFPQKAIGAGEPHAYRVHIENHGSNPKENARVVFKVNGQQESVSQITLQPLGSTQVLFTYAFDEAGSHVVEAEVITDDPLEFDNRYAISMTIWDKIKVVMVDGAPNSSPLKSETDFLRIALTPFELGRFQIADLVEAEISTLRQFDPDLIQSAKVVVLANVSKLEPQAETALIEFVKEGGVLFVFPGNRVDLNWYRTRLYNNGQGILPAPFGIEKGKRQVTSQKIVAQHFDHPSLAFFNDASNGDLTEAKVNRWYELEVADQPIENELRQNASVLIRLDNADPFLMECNYGKGVVMQLATTCDADWTDFPLKPAYLPFIQQLVTTTASRLIPARNLETGQSAILSVGQGAEQTVTVKTPSGAERVIQSQMSDAGHYATWDGTHRPGVYTFQTSQQRANFAVHTDRSESHLAALDSESLSDLAEQTGALVFESASDYLSNDELRRKGSEVWKILLACFLGFLFLEVFLQQRFARAQV